MSTNEISLQQTLASQSAEITSLRGKMADKDLQISNLKKLLKQVLAHGEAYYNDQFCVVDSDGSEIALSSDHKMFQ